MKKVSIGLVLIVSAVILYSIIHLSTVIYLPNVNRWGTLADRYGKALAETGGVLPIIVSILMGIIGIYLISIEHVKSVIDKI